MSPQEQALALMKQAVALLEPKVAPASMPVSAADQKKLASVGEVAHRHLAFLEAHDGAMTRLDSLEIRRELFPEPDRLRATANMFGRKDENAILYRKTPPDTPVRDDNPVDLTTEGRRVALLYRSVHGLA